MIPIETKSRAFARLLWEGPRIEVSSVQSKPLEAIPEPAGRQRGWINYEDHVAFVIIDKEGRPRIRTGHITSWPGSHGAGHEVDNLGKTVVWCDQVLNECADNADDAHEKTFDPKDPNLLRLDELEILKDPKVAEVWFKGVHAPEIARQISALVSLPDLGIGKEEKEMADRQQKFFKDLSARLPWWKDKPPVHT